MQLIGFYMQREPSYWNWESAALCAATTMRALIPLRWNSALTFCGLCPHKCGSGVYSHAKISHCNHLSTLTELNHFFTCTESRQTWMGMGVWNWFWPLLTSNYRWGGMTRLWSELGKHVGSSFTAATHWQHNKWWWRCAVVQPIQVYLVRETDGFLYSEGQLYFTYLQPCWLSHLCRKIPILPSIMLSMTNSIPYHQAVSTSCTLAKVTKIDPTFLLLNTLSSTCVSERMSSQQHVASQKNVASSQTNVRVMTDFTTHTIALIFAVNR